MATLLDSGILLRFFVSTDADAQAIRRAFRSLRRDREAVYVASQNVAEFWNVSTRPATARGGYGIPASIVEGRTRFIERAFRLITESPTTYSQWRSLLEKHQIVGVAVHDARLVAVMLEHRVSRILTLNPADFARYQSEGISVITPSLLAQGP